MSVITITADTRGVDDVLKRAAQPLDIRHAKAALVAFYVHREEEQFASARWRRLSKRYAKEKAKSHPGEGILRATGALYEGLTAPEVVDFTETTAVVGVRTAGNAPLFYARFAQKGQHEPKRTVMPGLRKGERDEVVDIIRVSVLQRLLDARR